MTGIIEKLKTSGLTGRGGACFPTGQKWAMVASSPEKERYIVCNASEGDPHCAKDKYLLENHLAEVTEGLEIAIETIKPKKTYIYLAPHFKTVRGEIEKAIEGKGIEIFDKPDNLYPHGEETVALNAIEGKPLAERPRPPYPTEKGLREKPTLINNVETFYWVGKIAKDQYRGNILVTISEKGVEPKVVEAKLTNRVSRILSKNGFPGDLEIQIGGILGKKGKLSQTDGTLEKTLAAIHIIKR